MEEQLIAFETAKLAKTKGFNITCKHWYDQTGALEPVKGIRGAMCYTNEGYAPTQSLLQKWLRVEHLLDVLVLPQVQSACDPLPLYFVVIEDYRNGEWKEIYNTSNYENKDTWLHFSNYEEALENGLLNALKLI